MPRKAKQKEKAAVEPTTGATNETTETNEAGSDANLDPIQKLTRDLKESAATMTAGQARFMVDAYYMMQENRKAAANQQGALARSGEPHEVIAWLANQNLTLEKQVLRALDKWSDQHEAGRWAKSITGIGPVIAAGLLAHIDAEKAQTAGHIWRFAGLDPTSKWEKKTKRPWNAKLKVLSWKIGESFVKVSGLESDTYGKVWLERKALEEERNAAGLFADQAKAKLEQFKIDKSTEAYKHYSEGRLPPGHIHARAKRYAVKLFLAHYQQVLWESAFKTPAPKPYIIGKGGHTHFIAPPNWPMKEAA
jgi:hypothetical protein